MSFLRAAAVQKVIRLSAPAVGIIPFAANLAFPFQNSPPEGQRVFVFPVSGAPGPPSILLYNPFTISYNRREKQVVLCSVVRIQTELNR